jgi:adenine-specific DNA-methyltransferase
MPYNNESIFAQQYNRNAWKKFLGETFQATLLTHPEQLSGITTDIAKEVFKLGDCTLDGESIGVYEVTLADGVVLERNRVGLRNLLRKHWQGISGAFIIYHKPESPRWRFTFVSEISDFDAAGNQFLAKTEPKRYTYVLGEGESVRTAAERFNKLAQKRATATLDDVKEAFSVEKLSDEFFDTYKDHYQNFVQFLTGTRLAKRGNAWEEQVTGTADAQFASVFNGDKKDVHDFCKKLLGRVVFLYFLQKKGWVG